MMSSFSKAVNIKIEHNNSFSDHDYCFKEAAVYEMDEENRSLFVDVENNDENDDCNARGRKRRSVKQPDFYNSTDTSSNGKKTSKAKPKNSSSKRVKSGEKNAKYEVEYIWGKRADKMRPNKVEYHVYWKGYPIEQSSWEPEDNLRLCQESIDRYEQREMYFNDKGEKEHSKGMKNGAAQNNVKVVVVNGAKSLKQVLPTMQAPRLSSASSSVSVPSLPSSHKKKKLPSPKKVNLMPIVKHANAETVPKTIDEFAKKLEAKVVVEILQHESCDIDGVPYLFKTRYGDGSVKKVIMRDLLDIAPRVLASYLAVALKNSEEGGVEIG